MTISEVDKNIKKILHYLEQDKPMIETGIETIPIDVTEDEQKILDEACRIIVRKRIASEGHNRSKLH